MIRVGVDVGNSGCKVAAFDDGGVLIRLARRSYTFASPRVNQREFDAEQILQAVLDCLAEVCVDGLGARVEAVAVSSQGEAIIPLDATGRPLAPVQASFDSRSSAAVEQVYKTIDGEKLEAITGNPPHSMFSLYKLLTIRREQPDLYRRIRRVAAFADWIAHRLGADLVMDLSLASRTSMLDVRARQWSSWVLEGLDVDEDLLPPLAASGTPIGTVSAGVASRTGLSPGATIAAGGHDQICCSLGAGVTRVGHAMNSMGTTDSLVGLCPTFDLAASVAHGGNAVGIGALDDYVMHGYVMSTGSTIAWYQRAFRCDGLSLNQLSERAWNDGRPSGIHFLPHMTGSGTPHLDSVSTGVFAGLTTESTPELIYRSILEGISFELRENLEHLRRAGASIETLTVIGGAAESPHYLQIKADVFGIPVQHAQVVEGGCLGAALLAGQATGAFPPLQEAARAACRIDRVYEPDPQRHREYDDMSRAHSRLYSLGLQLRTGSA